MARRMLITASMPSSDDILAGLTRIANEWFAIAVVWHVALALAALALATGRWRPSARSAALAAAAPVASAALFAWLARNPFNGLVLGAGALALVVVAQRIDRSASVRVAPPPLRFLGAGLIAFAWFYPHFLAGHPSWFYVFASPLGLVPCPSLSLAIGVGLCWNAFGSRAWGVTAGALGLLYGVVGVVRLAVWIDLALVVGAAVLAIQGARLRVPRHDAVSGAAQSSTALGR